MSLFNRLREALFPSKIEKNALLELGAKAVSILPLGAGIGAAGQSMILAKYHALPFFSWSQAVNDAVTLSVLLFPVAIGWYYSRIDNESFVATKKWLVLRMGCVIVISVIACPLAILAMRLLIPAASLQFALTVLLFGMIGHVLQTTSILADKFTENVEPARTEKVRLILVPAGYIFILAVTATWLNGAFQPMYGFFYDGLKVEVGTGTQQVIYMNDKYVIYGSGQVMANDTDLKFVIPPQNQ